MSRVRFGTSLLVVALLATGCGGDGESDESDPTTTSGVANTAITAAKPGSTTSVATTTTGGTARTTTAFTLPVYTIEARSPQTGGDLVVVLLAPGTYTDLDLENVVADVIERFAPIATLHLVDHAAAVPLVLETPDLLAPDEETLLEDHYLATLIDGFRMEFRGPFADVGPVVIGS